MSTLKSYAQKVQAEVTGATRARKNGSWRVSMVFEQFDEEPKRGEGVWQH